MIERQTANQLRSFNKAHKVLDDLKSKLNNAWETNDIDKVARFVKLRVVLNH